jgi:hypothetical protein
MQMLHLSPLKESPPSPSMVPWLPVVCSRTKLGCGNHFGLKLASSFMTCVALVSSGVWRYRSLANISPGTTLSYLSSQRVCAAK